MRSQTHRSRPRFRCATIAFFLAILPNIAFPKGPVCLDKSQRRMHPAFVVFSPDGKWIAATTADDVSVWDFATEEKVATFVRPGEKGLDVIAFSPDSQRIVRLDHCTGRVCLRDGSSGWADAPEREILGPAIGPDGRSMLTSGVVDLAFSPDGTLLAVPRGGKTIKVVALDTGREVGELDLDRLVNSVQFADEGKVLVVGSPGTGRDNPLVQFVDLETRTTKETLRVRIPPSSKFGYTNSVVLSPTESRLAVVLANINDASEVRLYEWPSGHWITLARYYRRLIFFQSFSPDGRLLAVPTHYGPGDPAAVRVWDLRAKVWRRFDCPPEIAQQNHACYNAKFSPDGRYLAAGLTHPEAAVCIWDLEEYEETSESE